MVQKEQVLGLVRHALTFFGGIVVAKGLATDSQMMDIVGMSITLIGAVWSVLDKKKS
jgi:hypothetical protein